MARERLWEELEALYADLDRELSVLRPLCQRSGRCCRFRQAGHQLWTTEVELDYLVHHAGVPAALATAGTDPGTCPYLKDGLCGVRDHRMLGCRIYFCDPGYEAAMGPLYEKYHARMKELHRRHGVPYRYEEFLGALTRRAAALP
jgi:Fe-S-cluster containining protein